MIRKEIEELASVIMYNWNYYQVKSVKSSLLGLNLERVFRP